MFRKMLWKSQKRNKKNPSWWKEAKDVNRWRTTPKNKKKWYWRAINFNTKKTLTGLENPFDDDADESKVVVVPENEESIFENEFIIHDTDLDEMPPTPIPNVSVQLILK